MNTLELFAGTGSFSKAAKRRGHKTFTSDYDDQFELDYNVDILHFDTVKLPYSPDIIWASPPCETFSIASVSHHWNKDRTPKSERAVIGQNLVLKTISLIEELNPKVWFIENPRGMLRKMLFMQGFKRYTVTYCQYGDSRMKPTDIWTNIDLEVLPMCKNGAPCHISAPRGSSTGTQGIKTYKDRSRVPQALCNDLLRQAEEYIKHL